MKTLAFDIGTSSIGWAYVDEDKNDIIGMGVRVFPEGVVDLGKGDREMSRNAQRRGARQVRRQYFRRVLRKQRLLKLLIEYKMTPFTLSDIEEWRKNGDIPKRPELTDWFRMNPYQLRHKALVEELTLFELGRVFYQLNQRRGFLSNSRNTGDDNEEGILQLGDAKLGKTGINSTREAMSNSTLGNYLASLQPKDGESYSSGKPRIRNRYTDRSMYTEEFDRIFSVQAAFKPAILNSNVREAIGGRLKEGDGVEGILFYQRPLRSQKGLIGKCTFEPTKPRAPISCLEFQEARVYQFVNSIECDGEKLSEVDKAKAVQFLFGQSKTTFVKLRKAIKKEDLSFNFNYPDDHPVVGSEVIKDLSSKRYFGAQWFQMERKTQEDIWHVIFSFDDKQKLKDYATQRWGFDEESAGKISRYKLPQGYASLSRKALRSILPFLRMGYTYDVAVMLGGVKNAFGKKWNTLTAEEKQLAIDTSVDIARSGEKGGFSEILKSFLGERYSLGGKELGKLYHHSQTQFKGRIAEKLPVSAEFDKEINSIRNPVVVQALFELRKVYNSIVDDFGKPDLVKVELARDLKQSKTQRAKVRRENLELERVNDRIKDELRAHNVSVSHENLLKYRLWEECQHTCPYTGKRIGIEQLFSGEVQIEHIFPWSRSLDDGFNNKTLCFADFNREKGDKTPYEYFSKLGETHWDMVKQRALKLFHTSKEFPKRYNKFKRFVQESFDEDLPKRHLNDTRYISLEAKALLEKVCSKVMVAPGMLTAKLRHMWGLNGILSEDDAKNREDHRHHAIDALVLACFKAQQLNIISRYNRYRNRQGNEPEFPAPWKGFQEDALNAVNSILVSHKKNKRIITRRMYKVKKDGVEYRNLGISARGQLHKETVFGKRTSPSGETAFHVRVPLETITSKGHVEKIVDEKIRELIETRIQEVGGYLGAKKDKVPDGVFFSFDPESQQKKPLIRLPNRFGDPVPVLKVRKSENLSNAVAVKKGKNQYVNPRNNHHVLIYKNDDGSLGEEVITLWTAVERKRKGESAFQVPEGKQLVATLQANDLFLLGLKDEEALSKTYNELLPHLFRVQKLSTKFYEFRHILESSLTKSDVDSLRRIHGFGEGKTGWITHNPIKVELSPSGKIRFV